MDSSRAGFFFALSAFLLWGGLPLYMKALSHVGALEIVAHRIVWSLPVGLAFIFLLGLRRKLLDALRQPRVLVGLAASALLISLNWLAYVQAVLWNVASEAALGYYINPLMSVLLARVLLGERLSRVQWAAIGLAAVAVAMLVVASGVVPWLGLVMATSFALYGYLRKTIPVGPTEGFVVEVMFLLPVALLYLASLGSEGVATFATSPLLLAGTGLVTAVPLILFAFGAKRLSLATIGLMQYVAPTLIFLTAILIFREEVDATKLAAFALIWLALALYSWSSLRQVRSSRDYAIEPRVR